MLLRLELLAITLAGCAAYPRLERPPIDPPAGAEFIHGAGGAPLYTETRLPTGEPAAIAFFVLGPEIGAAPAYPAFEQALLASGVVLSTVHPRGTGYSPGLRGDLDDYRLFLDDHRAGLEQVHARFPSLPIVLVGHSAGGAFALELAAKTRVPLAGVVLVNPAYKLLATEGMTPTLGDYLSFAANLVFRRSALTVDMNSRPSAVKQPADRAEGEALQADPLVVRYFSMRYLSAQKSVMDRCATNAAAVSAPLLLVQGAQDALVDSRGGDEILAAAKATDKTKLVAPDGGHGSSAVETLVQPIVQWLRARLTSPARESCRPRGPNRCSRSSR